MRTLNFKLENHGGKLSMFKTEMLSLSTKVWAEELDLEAM